LKCFHRCWGLRMKKLITKSQFLFETTEICEPQSDCSLRMRFINLSLDKLWISAKEECSTIHKKAIIILLHSLTNYMAEKFL
jgi:hypothetical protein